MREGETVRPRELRTECRGRTEVLEQSRPLPLGACSQSATRAIWKSRSIPSSSRRNGTRALTPPSTPRTSREVGAEILRL